MPDEQKTPLPPPPNRPDLDMTNPVERSIMLALTREYARIVGTAAENNAAVAAGRALTRELGEDRMWGRGFIG